MVGNANIIDPSLYVITVGKITVSLAWGRQPVDGLGRPRMARIRGRPRTDGHGPTTLEQGGDVNSGWPATKISTKGCMYFKDCSTSMRQ